MITTLSVSPTVKPVMLAGAIAASLRDQGRVELHAVGAGAVHQAVRAIAIARGYMAPSGFEFVCVPSFVEVDGGATGVRLLVEGR